MQVLKGAFDALMGKEVDYKVETVSTGSSSQGTASNPYIDAQAEQEITFTYCTQFLIMLEHPFTENQETEFKSYLESIGDSIVVVADDEIVKVHVHTNDPGMAMQRGLTYGSLTTIIIENMRLERDEKISAMKEKEMQNTANAENEIRAAEENEPEVPAEEKEMGFISVSIGEGINEIFRGLGVDYIIEGGQTMNPSTEDMLNAIAKVNAKTIYIFPNNKNIVLAANQARDLTEDKEIVVVPTKTIPQGITAMISYVPEKNSAENTEAMLQAIEHVKTGQITYAVRDTRIDDKEIHEGDMMGIGDHGILAVGKDRMEVAKETVAQMVDDESEVISIYYGADTEEAEAEELATALEEAYPDCDVELNAGGQPIYYYVISVE